MSSEGEPAVKKIRLDNESESNQGRVPGIAPIKSEYILQKDLIVEDLDDESEGRPNKAESNGQDKKDKKRGQNKNRKFDFQQSSVKFCEIAKDGKECPYGANCRFEHDVQKYLAAKPQDVEGVCPVFAATGECPAGIKCRWLGSHFKPESGTLVVDEEKIAVAKTENFETNRVLPRQQNDLQRKKYPLQKSMQYIKYLDAIKGPADEAEERERERAKEAVEDGEKNGEEKKQDNRASYVEPPFHPSEKKKLDLKGKKILSPLTTVGNLPYRRLMKTLGADITYSEMALALPLIQGNKGEWALTRAHSSEDGFGVQIAASKPWQAVKATQAISELAHEGTKEINLNCGCPIDLLYRQGAGSALLDNPSRLLKMTQGMAAMSGDIPVSIKIRMGTRDNHPTAKKLITRALDQGYVSAITLHGRSRAQRYTREADWGYIRETAEHVRATRAELDDRYENSDGQDVARLVKDVNFVGNGDVYSWEDWYYGVEECKVDSCMVARGALIKPWIFEEIESKQYLDKSGSERLDMIKQYANFGLEHWGSDEYGVNQTRRYMCEFLSFTHRYIPVGILEYLPPKLNDRPPHWKGRNDTETLLGSTNYKDWIKVTEMFLGPCSDSFDFVPKHKSNAY